MLYTDGTAGTAVVATNTGYYMFSNLEPGQNYRVAVYAVGLDGITESSKTMSAIFYTGKMLSA